MEIKSGIRPGDPIIYAGYESLHEGDPVAPAEWGPSGPRTLPPAAGDAAAGTVYTCPMHPEVRSEKPGDCPKCGMRLVPAGAGGRGPGAGVERPQSGDGRASGSGKAGQAIRNGGRVATSTLYVCPMDNDIRSDRPGKCPKCGMDLQPVPTSAAAPPGKAGAR